jgi:quercetin dioxygenase-like cupin family protein
MMVLEKDVKEILGPDANELAKYKVLLGKSNGVKGVALIIGNLAPGAETKPHRHEHEEELYYVIEGTGIWKIEGKEFIGKPGTAFFVPPNAEHSMVNNSKGNLKIVMLHSPASL